MRARVLTALALIPPVLVAIFCAYEWPFLALAVVAYLLGFMEIRRMLRDESTPLPLDGLALFAFVALFFLGQFELPLFGVAVVPAMLTALGVALTYQVAKRPEGKRYTLGPSLWLTGPLVALLFLHFNGAEGVWLWKSQVLLAIVPLWAGDTAAIFAGKAFGKHPLAPKISPKKTVEGSVANLIACMLAAWGLGAWIGLPLLTSLLCGAAAGIFGQAGDLFESWVKRQADLKDSGALLPGHGGIMDRIDSILFTAPLVSLIVAYIT